MKSSQHIRDILKAIESVKTRAAQAINSGEFYKATAIMTDVIALEVCLRIETQKLIDAEDNKYAA